MSATRFEIGLAQACDAEEIHALQTTYSLAQVRQGGRLGEGWLRAPRPVEELRFLIAHVGQAWVARSAGKIVASAMALPPTWMPFARWEHGFAPGSDATRAIDVLQRGQFIYVGSVATCPELRRQGVMSQLEAAMAEHYCGRALACHVGIFSQRELNQADYDLRRTDSSALNGASHAFYHRRGWQMVGYASTLRSHYVHGREGAMEDLQQGPYRVHGVPNDDAHLCVGLYLRFPEATPTTEPMPDPLRVFWRSTVRPVPPDAPSSPPYAAPNPWEADWELPVSPRDLATFTSQPSPSSPIVFPFTLTRADYEWERWYYLGASSAKVGGDSVPIPPGIHGASIFRRRSTSYGRWLYQAWPEAKSEPQLPLPAAERQAVIAQFLAHADGVTARCPRFEAAKPQGGSSPK